MKAKLHHTAFAQNAINTILQKDYHGIRFFAFFFWLAKFNLIFYYLRQNEPKLNSTYTIRGGGLLSLFFESNYQ